MYVNFSLFQSMPDAWGNFDQLFPVLPLEGLDQVPERVALCCWYITCDSDGVYRPLY